MLTMKHAIARALGAAALGAGVLIVTTAFANDQGGNWLDSDKCEHGNGYFNNNWCDSGPNGVHIQANVNQSIPAGYYIVATGTAGGSAYGVAQCNNGQVVMRGGVQGSSGPYYCPAGAVGNATVCGAASLCQNKL